MSITTRSLSVFLGFNYFQSVTPWLAVGGETFWLGQQRKSGTGFAARMHDDKSVATAQVASTGVVSLTYVHRVSEKARFATCACRWNWCSSSSIWSIHNLSAGATVDPRKHHSYWQETCYVGPL